MFNIEEILKMSEEMGINISDGTDAKHYILDEFGKRVEFNTDMLIKVDEEQTSYKMKLSVSTNCKDSRFSSSYKIADCKNSYVSKSVNVSESVIDAA